MSGIEAVKRSAVIAAGWLAAAVLLSAGQAQAQTTTTPCGRISDQPPAIFFTYLEELGGFFALPEAECRKIVKNAMAACHMAVRENEQCLLQLLASFRKASKVGCSVEGDDKDECNDFFGEDLEGTENAVQEDADDAHNQCDHELASSIRDACLGIIN
jgi:hypothetical protein